MQTLNVRNLKYTRENLIGRKFGRITVIDELERINKHDRWLCKCDCGSIFECFGTSLRSGRTKSCGCYAKDYQVMPHKHGLTNSKLMRIWCAIKQRCYNEKDKMYKYYGARGIKLSDEWLNNFKSFYDWSIENGYKEGLTIDRIDVNGNYEPSNCRWVGWQVQCNNKTNSKYITYNGETKTIGEWGHVVGKSRNTILHRYNMYNNGLISLDEIFCKTTLRGTKLGNN